MDDKAETESKPRHKLVARRKHQGFTQESLGFRIGELREDDGGPVASSTVRAWEAGHRTPEPKLRRPLALALDVTLDELATLLDPPAEPAIPQSLTAYLGLENSASRIEALQPRVLHGLCQIPEYARAIAESAVTPRTEQYIAQTLELRVRRQERLRRDQLPFTLVLGELALRLQVGGARTMADQLDSLGELAALPNVSVLVVPSAHGMYEGMRGPLTLLSLPWSERPTVHIEGYRSAFAEEHEIDHYKAVYKQASSKALSPKRSLRFIQQAAKDWERAS